MATPPSKRDPAYWRRRLFKNAFTYKGERVEVHAWSVKIQLFGKRKAFTLSSSNLAQAAGEACQIYQTILEQGWEAVLANGGGPVRHFHAAPGPLTSPSSIAHDTEYWKSRLVQRKYPEPLSAQEREFSVRIEHARRSQFFPLGTSDENEAARRALNIYRTVVNQGWASADAGFPRELAVAFRWQDNPLAWTYTTIHTQPNASSSQAALPLRAEATAHRVMLIESDPGIRAALESAINQQTGFRCAAAVASTAEALPELSRRRISMVLASHVLPDDSGQTHLEELRRGQPAVPVLTYSVFEDADQLFKSTPGGSAIYMLRRTVSDHFFEPIATLTEAPSRELIAAQVWKYFHQLSALLPSGPPDAKLARLTPRELEILEFLSKGDLLKEIAAKLGISNWTVQGHVKSIFEKLKVHSRIEAVIKFLQK